MKAYMATSRDAGYGEPAVLVFAHNVREAVNLSRPILDEWEMLESYIDAAAYLLKDVDWIFAYANQDKLKSDIAHVIESPPICKSCELWGTKLNEGGICENCSDSSAV